MSAPAPQLTLSIPHPGPQLSLPWPLSPVLLLLQPNSGPLAGGNPVTLVGLGLKDATQVLFDSTPATIGGGDPFGFTLNVIAPAGTGTVAVTVVSPGGTSGPQLYTYQDVASAPVAANILPASGPTSGGAPFVITGTNLTGAAVTFGGNPAAVVFSTSDLIIGLTPAGAAGNVPVVVTTAGGGATVPGGYTYVTPTALPPVVIGSIIPNSGPAAGGTPFTIVGSNLTGAAVTFGAATATITTNNGFVIAGLVPAGTAATTVPVTVTTPAGSAPAGSYSYLP
jgi:IPT/TIG domain-containing protein